MASKKKLLQAAAGAAGGEVLDIDDVFSTYLWEGNSTASRDIVNGIDLAGEGGITWIKCRTVAESHGVYTTDRGANKTLLTDASDAEDTIGTTVFESFNSDGFTVGTHGRTNTSGRDYVSWTFRKAPKFFDVVTYTGDGVAGRTVSHSLGANVGTLIVKKTNSTDNWFVWHRGLTDATYRIMLNSTSAETQQTNAWNSTAPSSTEFTLGDNGNTNASGDTYVAYLFAHNDGDGEFGPDGDQDIIKCGSYTGTGAAGNFIDLGFEPQWLMTKSATGSENWIIQDNMRSMTDTDYAWLRANLSNAEIGGAFSGGTAAARPTGFVINNTGTSNNGSGSTYIYMAIRRGPLAEPESATDVFDVDINTQAINSSNAPPRTPFPVDMGIYKARDASGTAWPIFARLQGANYLQTQAVDAEGSGYTTWDQMDGWGISNSSWESSANYVFYNWKRARGYFDVVAYTGTGSARTVSHNLGVVPEMMWVKKRSGGTGAWPVYHVGAHASSPENYFLQLNSTIEATDNSARWNDTAPTATVFTVGNGGTVNDSGDTYIAYLFATVAGVSKVGSFSHTNGGGDTNVDCGFSSNARLVIYKRTDSTGSWYIFDSVRGIVSGSGDAQLELNNTGAENTGFDLIDPYSSGFKIPSNAIGTGDYIFYAIA